MVAQRRRKLSNYPSNLENRVKSIIKNAEVYSGQNPQYSITLISKALELLSGNQNNNSLKMIKGEALRVKGQGYLELELYDQAIPCFFQALDLLSYPQSERQRLLALTGIGAGYMMMESYPESLQIYLKVLGEYQNLGDEYGQGQLYKNIGRLYLLLNEPRKALEHLEKSLTLSRKTANRNLEADSLRNLCDVHRTLGEFNRSYQAGLRSVELYQSLGSKGGEAAALKGIGETYLEMGDFPQALNFLHLTAEVSKTIGKKFEEARAYYKIGAIYREMKDYEQAVKFLEKALEYGIQCGSQRLCFEAHFELAKTYKQINNPELALEHFEKFYTFQQNVFNAESDRRLKTLEIVHQVETAKKDSEIHQLRNVELQQEIEVRKAAQEALEHLASTDSLTGLINRRHFMELGEHAFEQANRYHRPLSAIMLDIDLFKDINDTFGHAAGDKVLINVASWMQSVLRKVDLLGRYGGDEFVILLPETGLNGARRTAERLNEAIIHQSRELFENNVSISLSLGIATLFDNHPKSLDQLLHFADQALYQAKQAGRGRVAVYTNGTLNNI